MGPAGQLWSTLEDLSRWARFLAGRRTGAERVSVAEMRAPAVAPVGDGWDSGYGLGLQLVRPRESGAGRPGRAHRFDAGLPGGVVGERGGRWPAVTLAN